MTMAYMKESLVLLLTAVVRFTVSFLRRDMFTSDTVAELINDTSTQTFIAGFNNSYQRWIITQQLSNCPFIPLCEFTSGLSESVRWNSCCRPCYCDFPSCLANSTCCPDVIFRHIPVTENTTITRVDLEHFTGRETLQTCSSSSFPLIDESINVGVYMSASCSTGSDLAYNCSRLYTSGLDISDIIPVFSKASRGLFRNKYCAYCNDIAHGDIELLKAKVSCNIESQFKQAEDMMNFLFQEKSCNIEFVIKGNPDECRVAISECNTTGLWREYDAGVEKACQLYTSTVYVKKRVFKNIFCAYCNGYNELSFVCDVFPRTEGTYGFSFSGLLKLSLTDSTENEESTEKYCSRNQIYDKAFKRCKDIFCSPVMYVSQGKCIDMYEMLSDTSYIVYLRIKPIQQISVQKVYETIREILEYISFKLLMMDKLCSMQVLIRTNKHYDEENIEILRNSELLNIDIRTEIYIKYDHTTENVRGNIYNLTTDYFISSENDSFEISIRDEDPKYFDIVAILVDNLDPYSVGPGYFGSLPLSVLEQDYEFPGANGFSMIPYPFIFYPKSICYESEISLHIIRLNPCPKVNISKLDFDWETDTDGLIIKLSNFSIVNGGFHYIDNEHIAICVDTFRDLISHVPSLDQYSFSVETIVSIVCSALSIICLLITALAFSVFPQLRQTLPGKNSFSLVIYLLFAQCLYMVKGFTRLDTESSLCVFIGISLHFLWLVALLWMNNCTFHMFRVLTRTKIVSHDSGLKRLVLYHIYAIVMSAIFVGINIVVSLQVSGHIGYGGNVCYISSQEMINYTFLIPTCFVVVTNIFMFFVVIFKVRQTSSINKSVQHERNNLLVFTKLSTITGTTWIFGVLYSFSGFAVFSYLFISLNAFQGVFIMLAFITNRRVYDLLKSKATVYKSSVRSKPVTNSTVY